MSDQTPLPKEGEILLYATPAGTVRVEVFFQGETFWLTQARMAELFGTTRQAIGYHLRNIFESKELERGGTSKEILLVRNEGSREVARGVEYHNLDAIIAVGYRVNSFEATQFRIWATKALREFIIKGFVLDDERLKQGKKFGADYFEELLERIRAIRASERRFYLDYAENQAARRIPMRMQDWVGKLDACRDARSGQAAGRVARHAKMKRRE